MLPSKRRRRIAAATIFMAGIALAVLSNQILPRGGIWFFVSTSIVAVATLIAGELWRRVPPRHATRAPLAE